MRIPKGDLCERYMAALPSLILRPIFVIRKMNKKSRFHSKKVLIDLSKMVSKKRMFDYIVEG